MCLAGNAGLCLLTNGKSEIKATISSCEFCHTLFTSRKQSQLNFGCSTNWMVSHFKNSLSKESCFLPFLGIIQTKQWSEQLQIVWRWKRFRTRCRKSNDEMANQVGTNAQFKCGVNRNDVFVKSQKANLQMDIYGSSFNPALYP